MILPKEDKYYSTKTKMKEQIIHLLGGRVAEKLTLHDISTGASNDILRATEIAREMVTKYGFSEKLGTVNYSSSDEVFLGKDFSTRKNYSEEVASAIDAEIKSIIEEAFAEAEKILTENEKKLHIVAASLLEVETLDGTQFETLYTGEMTSEELVLDIKHKEEQIKEANEKEAAESERIRKREKRRARRRRLEQGQGSKGLGKEAYREEEYDDEDDEEELEAYDDGDHDDGDEEYNVKEEK